MTFFAEHRSLLRHCYIILLMAHFFIGETAQYVSGTDSQPKYNEGNLELGNLLSRLVHRHEQDLKGRAHGSHSSDTRSTSDPQNSEASFNGNLDIPVDTCEELEWYVIIRGTPACVNPLWTIGYDPYFCSKLNNGLVYCGCDEGYTPGVKEGVDTCIKQADSIRLDRCSLSPCPPNIECNDTIPGVRYDCVKDGIVVPSFYGKEN